MLDCIEGLQSKDGRDLVLSVENQGSIPGLEDRDVVEITCHVDETGIHPVRVEEVPEHCYLLMRLIKMYEKETVEAVQELSLIHISEPTRLGMNSYAVFCLQKKKNKK